MNVDEILAALTIDEKAELTHGEDLWSTHAIERLGIPKIVLTDGPNGARGPIDPEHSASPSTCVPCGSALGASWDPQLIAEVGALVGREARQKGCRVLLAPTVNMHRSPLAGRNFECYSEDPLLAGRLAASFVRGVQSQGVAVTVKHFAANDSEHERYVMSSVVDDRALREIYLVPFELAVREGGALGIMTAYNRVNGVWCSEHVELIEQILRHDWGFDGFVVSDWFAAGSTVASAHAGLDLEMPGPGRFFGRPLADAVRAGLVAEAVLDARARNVLRVFDRIGALDPDDDAEPAIDDDADDVARRAAADAMVLLKNDGVLPFDVPTLARVAVIGPNADRAHIMGGGSASLTPRRRITPLAALREQFGAAVELVYEPGCIIDRYTPALPVPLHAEFFASDAPGGEVVHEREYESGRVTIFGAPPGVGDSNYSFRARATVTATKGRHIVSLVQVGRARVFVDGALVIDGVPDEMARGPAFYGAGSREVRAVVDFDEPGEHTVVVDYRAAPNRPLQGVIVGWQPQHPDDHLDRAVEAARAADAVVVVVGTSDDWESEGFDRDSLHLPGQQDELVRRVVAANPRCAIVVNAGSPIAMPWIDEAAAVLVCGLGGQEMATALAEVLVGGREPAGRLPTTYPVRIEDTPSFLHYPGEFGEVRYGESIFVGHRWYSTRAIEPLFAFGHGLSYTTWTTGPPHVSTTTFVEGSTLSVEVPVTNTGDRRGAHVVQCYIEPLEPRVSRPLRELKGFAKLWLDPGERGVASIRLDDRSFAYWFPGDRLPADTTEKLRMPLASVGPIDTRARWKIDPGRYRVHIGSSSAALTHAVDIEVVAPAD